MGVRAWGAVWRQARVQAETSACSLLPERPLIPRRQTSSACELPPAQPCKRPGWTLGTSPQPEKEGWGKRHVPPGDGRAAEKAWCSPQPTPPQHYLGADATLLVLKGIWGEHRAYEIRMLLPKVSTSQAVLPARGERAKVSGTECSRLASALPLPSLTNQQQGGARGWEGARFKEALTVSIAQVPILHGHGPEKEGLLKFGMRVSFFTLLLALASRAWFTHSGRGCPEPPEESWGSSLATLGPLCSP